MKISKEAKRCGRLLYLNSLTSGRLDEARAKVVLGELLARRPSGYIQILKEYYRLVRLELETRTAQVASATPLAHDEEVRIDGVVRDRIGSDAKSEFTVDSDLIAGVRIRIGSHVYESSIRGRLDRLRWELAH